MASAELEGRCYSLFVMTMFFAIICLMFVSLRCFTRLAIRGFGLDDWLMLIGEFFAICTFVAVLLGCKAGLGQHDKELTPEDAPRIKQAIVAFQVLYCATLIFVKSSICVALIRLAVGKRMLCTLYAVLTLSSSYGFVAMMTILTQCRPFSANWDSSGTCADKSVTVNISYFVTACSIITDCACSILPFVILWNLQMKKRLKFTISALLGLGFFASAATIARTPYLDAYYATEEMPFQVSRVVLYSVLEVGVAIIVGSIPSLKPLVRSIAFFGSHSGSHLRGRATRLNEYQSFVLKSVVNHGVNNTQIQGKVTRSMTSTDNDSLRKILREDPERIFVSSEVHIGVEGISERPGTGKTFKSFTF